MQGGERAEGSLKTLSAACGKMVFRLPYPVNKGSLKNTPMERRRLADILSWQTSYALFEAVGDESSPLHIHFRLPQTPPKNAA